MTYETDFFYTWACDVYSRFKKYRCLIVGYGKYVFTQ